MENSAQRRVGRPTSTVLDRRRIGEVALAVVDGQGDFKLSEIASRLGVQTASLYHHVAGRAGMIELLRERIGEEMDLTPLAVRPWDVALRGWFRAYRDVFAAHPRVVPLLATTTVRAPQVIVAYEQVAAILAEAEVPERDVMAIVTAMENFVIGSALDLAAPEIMWEIEDLDAPHLQAALSAQDASAGRAERAFEYGLEMFLDSIRSGRGASVG